MKEETKAELLTRLKRAEGQVAALRRMVEADEECVDVLLQISAARGALSKSGQVLLKSHIETCVSGAFASGGPEASRRHVAELMEVFDRFGGLAAR